MARGNVRAGQAAGGPSWLGPNLFSWVGCAFCFSNLHSSIHLAMCQPVCSFIHSFFQQVISVTFICPPPYPTCSEEPSPGHRVDTPYPRCPEESSPGHRVDTPRGGEAQAQDVMASAGGSPCFLGTVAAVVGAGWGIW